MNEKIEYTEEIRNTLAACLTDEVRLLLTNGEDLVGKVIAVTDNFIWLATKGAFTMIALEAIVRIVAESEATKKALDSYFEELEKRTSIKFATFSDV